MNLKQKALEALDPTKKIEPGTAIVFLLKSLQTEEILCLLDKKSIEYFLKLSFETIAKNKKDKIEEHARIIIIQFESFNLSDRLEFCNKSLALFPNSSFIHKQLSSIFISKKWLKNHY